MTKRFECYYHPDDSRDLRICEERDAYQESNFTFTAKEIQHLIQTLKPAQTLVLPIKSHHESNLKSFVRLMDAKLYENQHKGNWADCGIQYLLWRLCDEVAELIESFEVQSTSIDVNGPREAFTIAANHLRCSAGVLRHYTATVTSTGRVRRREDEDSAGECADVANFAMMISEAAKLLTDWKTKYPSP